MLCLPLFSGKASGLMGFLEPDSHAHTDAVLYFRYQDSPWLVQEARRLELSHTQSLEMALVAALLAGPDSERGSLQALFPENVQLLSVLAEDERLYVTFSKELMDALPGENSLTGPGRQQAQLRRRLAMASLVNTLTESGLFQSVQVLVVNQPGNNNSMRLNMRYYLDEDSSIPDPLLRQEEAILTPGRAAEHLLGLWQKRSTRSFLNMVALPPADSQETTPLLDAQALPLLQSFALSTGSLALDGSYAIVLLDAQLLDGKGQQKNIASFPLKLLRQGPDWLISLKSLQKMLGGLAE